MVTNIKHFSNQSDRSAIALNSENIGNSFWIPSFGALDTDLWVSYHSDHPLLLTTKKGVCHVVDQNWQIRGQWEGGASVVFLDGGGAGVGGEITVAINSTGEITMAKK
jgi:hypothetical protein